MFSTPEVSQPYLYRQHIDALKFTHKENTVCLVGLVGLSVKMTTFLCLFNSAVLALNKVANHLIVGHLGDHVLDY